MTKDTNVDLDLEGRFDMTYCIHLVRRANVKDLLVNVEIFQHDSAMVCVDCTRESFQTGVEFYNEIAKYPIRTVAAVRILETQQLSKPSRRLVKATCWREICISQS